MYLTYTFFFLQRLGILAESFEIFHHFGLFKKKRKEKKGVKFRERGDDKVERG